MRASLKSYKGLDSKLTPTEGGFFRDLNGFFECIADKNVRISILCQDDVEMLYDLTYDQGYSITVHMNGRDLIFYKKNKLYVADFSSWIQK